MGDVVAVRPSNADSEPEDGESDPDSDSEAEDKEPEVRWPMTVNCYHQCFTCACMQVYTDYWLGYVVQPHITIKAAGGEWVMGEHLKKKEGYCLIQWLAHVEWDDKGGRVFKREVEAPVALLCDHGCVLPVKIGRHDGYGSFYLPERKHDECMLALNQVGE